MFDSIIFTLSTLNLFLFYYLHYVPLSISLGNRLTVSRRSRMTDGITTAFCHVDFTVPDVGAINLEGEVVCDINGVMPVEATCRCTMTFQTT